MNPTAVAIMTGLGTLASILLAIFAILAVNQTKRTIRESDLRLAEEKGALKQQVITTSSCLDALTIRVTSSEGAHNELRNDVTLILGKIDTLGEKIEQFYQFMDRRIGHRP